MVTIPAPGGPPRLVVAAPASGAGKTTVATGLVAALARRGLAVSAHKVGPDYIDPGYHALASGRPARNLDAYLCGERRIAPLFLHGAAEADVAVIEGVMGLFDGAPPGPGDPPDMASAAHVARLLDAPVLLVVDVSAQAASVAALVHGFATYDPRVRIGGVVLNQVGSPRHEQLLREALAAMSPPVPVLGAIAREDRIRVPSRHLGLVPAAERSTEAEAAVAAMAELIGHGCDLDAILAMAAGAPRMSVPPWDPHVAVGPAPRRAGARVPSPRPRIAVAGGPAFTFAYTENTELLRAAGAEVCTVDPMRDEALPPGTAAVVIGGGFPEMHVAALSANERLRKDLADFAASGGLVLAECAGLLYLGRAIDEVQMCGVLDLRARFGDRLTLGYRQATAVTDSVLARRGERVRGHEFHRTACEPAHGPGAAWTWTAGGHEVTEGFADRRVHASYLHLHWAGHPQIARRVVETARRAEIRGGR